MSDLRIATFKVEAGGNGEYKQEMKEPKNIHALKAVLAKLCIGAIRSDIVALSDTFGWTKLYGNEGLVEEFGYPYAACIDLEDKRLKELYGEDLQGGVALLSWYELYDIEILQLAERQALSARVLYPGSEQKLRIVAAYLDDLNHPRNQQAEALAQQLDPNEPIIIAGDLNNEKQFNRRRRFASCLGNVALGIRPRNRLLQQQITAMRWGQAIEVLERAGFYDADPYQAPTALSKYNGRLMPPLLALDRFICSPKVLTSKVRVFDGREDIRVVSDHLPAQLDVQHIVE